MWFGLYLYDHELISAKDFVDAMRTRFRSYKPLGRLAVESGKLTTQEVYELLVKQISDPRPIAELAVDMGLLSRRDVAELLLTQSEQAMSVGNALIELGVLTREEVILYQARGRCAMAERAQDGVGVATAV